MQSAKAAVKNFLDKDGKTDTTVTETVAPTVVKENVNVLHDNKVQTAVDKEVHQDHYHSSVQPIKNQTVEQTQHHDNVLPVQHKHIEHDDPESVKAKLAERDAQYESSRNVNETHTQSAGAAVAGEHVHHHVHERIQPVLQQETIQPHVTHTTVPVHEVHHNAAQHHATTALPAVSLSEFQAAGGELAGRGERQDAFEGAPAGLAKNAGSGMTGSGMTGTTTSSTTQNNTRDSVVGGVGEKLDGGRTGNTGMTGTTGTTGTTGSDHKVTPMSTTHDDTTGKPSVVQKIKNAIRDD